MGFLTKGSFEKRAAVLTRHRDENPELAHLYEARLTDVAAWKETSSSAAGIEQIRGVLRDVLEDVEAALGASEFLAGSSYTLADVAWTVILARLRFMGWQPHWGEATLSYYQRMKARESFGEADIWERPRPLVMLPIIGQVLAMKVGLR